MALFYQPDFTAASTFLDAEESRHLAKVLRMSNGQQIEVTDGKGKLYTCEIKEANQKKTIVDVLGTESLEPSKCYKHIAIAPTKNLDRIEWFVEKAVEFGIDEISFVLCQNSERRVLKTERIFRKAVSAMKQSGNLFLPKINELKKFNDILSSTEEAKFIAYVDFDNQTKLESILENSSKNIVLIGPEGDFTQDEVSIAMDSGFKKVSLGNSRLRTETAGIAAIHILNLFCK